MNFHTPPRPTTSAAEKLMMLGCYAVCRLIVAHFKLRAIKGDIDPAELEKAADELRRIAWDAERNQA